MAKKVNSPSSKERLWRAVIFVVVLALGGWVGGHIPTFAEYLTFHQEEVHPICLVGGFYGMISTDGECRAGGSR